jgi:hypothetical protein
MTRNKNCEEAFVVGRGLRRESYPVLRALPVLTPFLHWSKFGSICCTLPFLIGYCGLKYPQWSVAFHNLFAVVSSLFLQVILRIFLPLYFCGSSNLDQKSKNSQKTPTSFFVELAFELRALCLLVRHSIVWATPPALPTFFFFFNYCAEWGYIVAFTEVLIIYQICHIWIYPLHHSPLFLLSPFLKYILPTS